MRMCESCRQMSERLEDQKSDSLHCHSASDVEIDCATMPSKRGWLIKLKPPEFDEGSDDIAKSYENDPSRIFVIVSDGGGNISLDWMSNVTPT